MSGQLCLGHNGGGIGLQLYYGLVMLPSSSSLLWDMGSLILAAVASVGILLVAEVTPRAAGGYQCWDV